MNLLDDDGVLPSWSQDYNDTLLAIYLASMTKGVSAVNDIVDKYTMAYEKTGGRRRGGPIMM